MMRVTHDNIITCEPKEATMIKSQSYTATDMSLMAKPKGKLASISEKILTGN